MLDGTDDFATRFAVNAACVAAGKILVSGAIGRWTGQVGVFAGRPCYRCLVPEIPPDAETCSAVGVVGALAGMLQRGEIAGAGLDVYEHEPTVNPKLLKLPNVVLLPHMSSATIEGRIDMGEKVIINIRSFVDGHKPPDRVIPAML